LKITILFSVQWI